MAHNKNLHSDDVLSHFHKEVFLSLFHIKFFFFLTHFSFDFWLVFHIQNNFQLIFYYSFAIIQHISHSLFIHKITSGPRESELHREFYFTFHGTALQWWCTGERERASESKRKTRWKFRSSLSLQMLAWNWNVSENRGKNLCVCVCALSQHKIFLPTISPLMLLVYGCT